MSKDEDHSSDRGQIKLSVPWDYMQTNTMPSERVRIGNSIDRKQWLEEQDSRNTFGIPSGDEAAMAFLRERTRVHETYIKEQERTKRIGMILSAVLILGAAALILFAPAGRETLSYWIGAALVVFAAGTMGYQRIWGKSKNLSFGADQDRGDL